MFGYDFDGKIKLVFTKTYNFEYRRKSLLITRLSFWDYRDFAAKSKLKELSIKSFSPIVDCLVETLMLEIKPVLTEKIENEIRDYSILVALF